ncbi:phage tail protein [Loktanella sp. S4079]|uniref:phage tail protein n=1 Tax=Loktanella sp. S4079 TaxID=579483 RepID=UPI0005F9BD65|nr:tail fiber protein [Loktanella sp. S4079]KJZ17564.1 hypothetical protein TW80_17020 [Loktanella sp. S4079]
MEPILGQVIMFGGNFAPRGWAFCDGQLLPIASNSALFSLLGTTYGGDGRSTFGLPDLRGRAPIHAGTGNGLSPRQIGQRVGREDVTLTVAEMPAHGHGVMASSSAADSVRPSNDYLASANIYSNEPGRLNELGTQTITPTGGSQPHENMQPSLVINYIIALQGVYPSRS